MSSQINQFLINLNMSYRSRPHEVDIALKKTQTSLCRVCVEQYGMAKLI